MHVILIHALRPFFIRSGRHSHDDFTYVLVLCPEFSTLVKSVLNTGKCTHAL